MFVKGKAIQKNNHIPVWLNVDNIVSICEENNVARMIDGDKYLIDESFTKGRIVACEEDTGGSTKNLQRYRWHEVQGNDMPKSDRERVIVCTKDGNLYFSSTINGKFLKDVVFWTESPQKPAKDDVFAK